MSARPIATATISFGLVSVPVKLYSSSESSARIAFNWVDKKTGSRVKQQYISPKDGRVVPKDEMVKGYEFSKGQFVIFTPDELKALDEKATNSIDIAEFVPLAKVDRLFLDRAYFLGPDKGGERAYRLLSEALTQTGRAALGQYAARGQQHLVLVRPADGVLVLEQLHYADELRSVSEVPLGEGEVKEQELELAKQLIDQTATEEFRPEAYKDNVRDRVLEAIQRKVDGEEITSEPAEVPQTKILDLMAALKASLSPSGEADEEPTETATKPKGKKKAAS